MDRIEKDFRQLLQMVEFCNDIIKDSGKKIIIDVVSLSDNTGAKEYLKFYADTPSGEKNKLFTFQTTLLDLENTLLNMIRKGFLIRSAWYHCKSSTGEVIENRRITDVQRFYDQVLEEQKNNASNSIGSSQIFQTKI